MGAPPPIERRLIRVGHWSPLQPWIRGLGLLAGLAGLVVAVLAWQWLSWLAALVAIALFVGLRLFGPALTIAHDGLLLHGFLVRRSIPFSKLARVRFERREVGGSGLNRSVTPKIEVCLELKDGREIGIGGARPGEIFDAIVEPFRVYRASNPSGLDPAPLLPAGDTSREWIDRLRGLLASGHAYRADAPTDEELLSLAEDAHAPEAARAAAAVALGAGLRVESREAARLREIAEASASPHVRAAIVATLANEEDALVAAMEELRGAASEREHQSG